MTQPDAEELRRAAIVAVFSVDELVDRLVLKGGNAIALLHGLDLRGSLDLDFSMADEFTIEELPKVKSRLAAVLGETYLRLNQRTHGLSF